MAAITLTFEHFDQAVADAMVGSNRFAEGADGEGLPGYLGIRTRAVEAGRLTCELAVTEELLNPFGAAHGGVVSALIDHVLGAVCFPVVPRGSWPATQEFKLNFLAPARPGPMIAEASILSMSKRTAIVRVDVSNSGRLVCAAQGTVAIMPPKPAPDGALPGPLPAT
ncbi:PaaI family thioesterase [Acidiferrimicrobium sp. IK]|uniref:PaaI family thioesterase n=1 Tax=Acidiferrimicrobium sp. IK TaxID=2871700 RepID=UPI0021CB6B9D|nr:PaaI family thioesterase [Acidiferrimicrobium sp. IK]MCU4184598.1 PaaI family thioesterase [Acidiferrimicrobium sp. IK]